MSQEPIRRLRRESADFARGYREGRDALEAGLLLRGLREGARLTQTELARRLGVSQARVAQAERGAGRDGPTYGYIKRVARACGAAWPADAGAARPAKPRLNVEVAASVTAQAVMMMLGALKGAAAPRRATPTKAEVNRVVQGALRQAARTADELVESG